MSKKMFPLHPARPEKICWGCDKYCPATDMACGNGSDRTQHPSELFGDDWYAADPSAPARTPDAEDALIPAVTPAE
jgi:hypothetical protein